MVARGARRRGRTGTRGHLAGGPGAAARVGSALHLQPLAGAAASARGAGRDPLPLGPGGNPRLGRAALHGADPRSARRRRGRPARGQLRSRRARRRGRLRGGRWSGGAQSQLHLRALRDRRGQPPRARRDAGRRRGARGGLQPALPARAAGPRQDPPIGLDRQLPARQRARASASATRRPSRFTQEFVAALRCSGAEAFKSRYRDIDVLLVDDIQFLEGKHHTEEEFFHTFNALYEAGSQLVLSADRIPSELSTLAARLRDRFEWGLTVSVEPPNAATRAHRPATPPPRGRNRRSPIPRRSSSWPVASTPTSVASTAP